MAQITKKKEPDIILAVLTYSKIWFNVFTSAIPLLFARLSLPAGADMLSGHMAQRGI